MFRRSRARTPILLATHYRADGKSDADDDDEEDDEEDPGDEEDDREGDEEEEDDEEADADEDDRQGTAGNSAARASAPSRHARSSDAADVDIAHDGTSAASTHAGGDRPCKLCNHCSSSPFPLTANNPSLKRLMAKWNGKRPWLHHKARLGQIWPSGSFCLVCFYVWRQLGENLKFKTLRIYLAHVRKQIKFHHAFQASVKRYIERHNNEEGSSRIHDKRSLQDAQMVAVKNTFGRTMFRKKMFVTSAAFQKMKKYKGRTPQQCGFEETTEVDSNDELVEGVIIPITRNGHYEVHDFNTRETEHKRIVESGEDMITPEQAVIKFKVLKKNTIDQRAKDNKLTTAEMVKFMLEKFRSTGDGIEEDKGLEKEQGSDDESVSEENVNHGDVMDMLGPNRRREGNTAPKTISVSNRRQVPSGTKAPVAPKLAPKIAIQNAGSKHKMLAVCVGTPIRKVLPKAALSLDPVISPSHSHEASSVSRRGRRPLSEDEKTRRAMIHLADKVDKAKIDVAAELPKLEVELGEITVFPGQDYDEADPASVKNFVGDVASFRLKANCLSTKFANLIKKAAGFQDIEDDPEATALLATLKTKSDTCTSVMELCKALQIKDPSDNADLRKCMAQCRCHGIKLSRACSLRSFQINVDIALLYQDYAALAKLYSLESVQPLAVHDGDDGEEHAAKRAEHFAVRRLEALFGGMCRKLSPTDLKSAGPTVESFVHCLGAFSNDSNYLGKAEIEPQLKHVLTLVTAPGMTKTNLEASLKHIEAVVDGGDGSEAGVVQPILAALGMSQSAKHIMDFARESLHNMKDEEELDKHAEQLKVILEEPNKYGLVDNLPRLTSASELIAKMRLHCKQRKIDSAKFNIEDSEKMLNLLTASALIAGVEVEINAVNAELALPLESSDRVPPSETTRVCDLMNADKFQVKFGGALAKSISDDYKAFASQARAVVRVVACQHASAKDEFPAVEDLQLACGITEGGFGGVQSIERQGFVATYKPFVDSASKKMRDFSIDKLVDTLIVLASGVSLKTIDRSRVCTYCTTLEKLRSLDSNSDIPKLTSFPLMFDVVVLGKVSASGSSLGEFTQEYGKEMQAQVAALASLPLAQKSGLTSVIMEKITKVIDDLCAQLESESAEKNKEGKQSLDPIMDKVAKLLETIPAYEADAIQWAAALSKRGVLTNLVSHQNKLENRLTSVKDDPADVVVTRIESIVVQYALHTTSVVAADAADLKQLRATVNSVGDLSCPEALLNAAHEKIVELEGKFGRGRKRKAVGEGVDATTAKGVTIAKAAKK
jgi:hypothetical protein